MSLASSTSNIDSGWVVQKYGGTSVGKFPGEIADIVKKYIDDGNRVAVVVSARSTDTKEQGTTNRLLAAAKAALETSADYVGYIEAIRRDHVQAAKVHVHDKARQTVLVGQIEEECDRLLSFLNAAQIIEEISPKSRDIIVGTGEKLSALYMTAVLCDRGVDAEAVMLERVVPDSMGKSKRNNGLDQGFYDHLSQEIADAVLSAAESGKTPVVTGFFGLVPGSLLSQIGRGYTDLCAALLAVGTAASELQVWKEVDGIFTADPRKVPTARLLAQITPEEAAELTYYGSEVIHPFFTNLVSRARIPIRIKNVENPMGDGTVILSDTLSRRGVDSPYHPPKLIPSSKNLFAQAFENSISKTPTAVTAKENIVIVNVHSNRRSLSHGFYATLFSILDRHRVIVDLISTSEVHVSMAMHSEDGDSDFRAAIDDLKAVGIVEVLRGMIILSLVGKQMKNMVGIAGKMFTTLAANNINIEMISQGARFVQDIWEACLTN